MRWKDDSAYANQLTWYTILIEFLGGANGKEPTCQCRRYKNASLIPGSGRSPGGRHGNSLQYSCLENPMDRETWWATVRRVPKSWTGLKWQHACMYLKFKAYIKIHSWCCPFYEFWQMKKWQIWIRLQTKSFAPHVSFNFPQVLLQPFYLYHKLLINYCKE